MRVIVVGSLSHDYIMNFSGRFADRIMPEKIHILSLSFFARTLRKELGGTALNQAYTLKLLGDDPFVITTAGSDWQDIRAFMKKHTMETAGIVRVSDEPSSSYHVITDEDDNQIGAFYAGASKYNKNLKLKQRTTPSLVIIGPTDPIAVQKLTRDCQALGYPYLYDPAFQIASLPLDDLRGGIRNAKLFIGNDYEIALVENRLGISHAELVGMASVLVTTLAGKGSIIETKKEAIHVKAAKPKGVVDPTGAGDAYRAGFVAGYLRGFDLQVCGQMGSVAAAYTVEKYGTTTHYFTKKEFIARYKQNYVQSIKL